MVFAIETRLCYIRHMVSGAHSRNLTPVNQCKDETARQKHNFKRGYCNVC